MKNFYTKKTKQIIIGVCLLGLFGFANIYAQQDWEPIAPPGTPDARQGHSMVTLPNGDVFMFGGEDKQADLFNDLYDFDNQGWAKVIPSNTPPPPRKNHQAWTRADVMYIYGGEGENGPLDDLWSYNVTENTWHQEEISGPRPPARHGQATTKLTDGSVLIVAGTGADGTPLKDCWRLNTDNTYTQLQDPPYAYTGHSTVLSTDGEWLYVFGKPGSLGIYRVSTDRWTSVAGGTPNGEGCMTSRGTNSAGEPVVYVFGGKDNNGNEMNQSYEYNLYNGAVTQRENMPQPIVNGATAQIGVTPPAAGLLKGTMLDNLTGVGETNLVFGGVSNGAVTNNEYLFSTQTPPDTIITIATADTIKADTVQLFWNIDSIGATYYEAQVLLDTTANTVFADTVLTDTTVTITNLEPQTNYYWRVRGYNAGGWGESSVILHFYTDFVTGIKDNKNTIPKEFKLYQNYPNPFNPTTTIKYEIPAVISNPNGVSGEKSPEISPSGRNDNNRVTLKIYDILGREIATLVNKKQTPGNYEIQFNAGSATGGLPSGIYFYRLTAESKTGKFIKTKKMVLMK
jgi:hypothetical protein